MVMMYNDMVARRQAIEADRNRGVYKGPDSVLEQIAQKYGANASTSKYPRQTLVVVTPENEPYLSEVAIRECMAAIGRMGFGVGEDTLGRGPEKFYSVHADKSALTRLPRIPDGYVDAGKMVFGFYLDTKDPRFLDPIAALFGLHKAAINP